MSSLSLPNIALVLVDDMNVDDIHVMHRTRRGLNIEFANAFTTTPLCCPSRASFFSGRHQQINNLFRGGCYNDTWIFGSERRTFAVHAKAAGYTTSLAGKYLNNYALAGSHESCARSGDPGCFRVPPGWDDWHALRGNARYYRAKISENGRALRVDGSLYLPDLFFNSTRRFIVAQDGGTAPWLAVYAPPSCHSATMQEPAYPAARHEGALAGIRHPRSMPNYNATASTKHWLMRQRPPLSRWGRAQAREMDTLHQRRLESLLAVDEHIGELLALIHSRPGRRHLVAFSSDHGFALGQHRQPADKRQPYEHLIRIPLRLAWADAPSMTLEPTALNIDLAATVVALIAGVAGAPSVASHGMEGRSLLPWLSSPPPVPWRRDFLLSHRGEGPLPGETPCGLEACWCDVRNKSSHRVVRVDCRSPKGRRAARRGSLVRSGALYYVDGRNNTFDCVRTLDGVADDLYCEFDDDERFVEFYDHRADPWQLRNLAHRDERGASAADATIRRRQHRLRQLLVANTAGGQPPVRAEMNET